MSLLAQVAVEDRPIPKVKDEGDVVVKNKLTALCGSDLHICEPSPCWLLPPPPLPSG